jgi:hypothetical protein
MAGLGQGKWIYAGGKISLLRIGSTLEQWGGGDDVLRTEVTVQLEGDNQRAFGFDLHTGDKELPSQLGMLSVLRDAYIHDIPLTLGCWLEEGKKNGYIGRVQLNRN